MGDALAPASVFPDVARGCAPYKAPRVREEEIIGRA
jgi:hypothetical protein